MMNEAEAADQPLRQERPVPAPRPRRTIIDIATFSGQNNEDIGEWLIKRQVAAAANGWTEEQQLQLLPAFLSGRAARMFWRIPLEARNDLEQVKECLDELFNTEDLHFLGHFCLEKFPFMQNVSRIILIMYKNSCQMLMCKGLYSMVEQVHEGINTLTLMDLLYLLCAL